MERLIKFMMLICFVGVFVFSASTYAEETQRLFGNTESLENIREKIEQNALEFTVEHNWVYDLNAEEKARLFSRKMRGGKKDNLFFEPTHRLLSSKNLPLSFDWRNRNGESYIGPVRDQANCGSCYAFGAVAAAEGTYNVANGLTGSSVTDFSESYIMWCLGTYGPYGIHFGGCDGADYAYAELKALTVEGMTWEANFPYLEYDPGSCTYGDDPMVLFDSWGRIPCNDINAMKTAIMNYGVVDVAVYVTDAFSAYAQGIYEDDNTECEDCESTWTNHAVALVGWDDNGNAEQNGYWILRNSWGQGWGENGYMRIKYRSAAVACAGAYLVYQTEPVQPSITHIAISGASNIDEGAETALICQAYYSDDSVVDISNDVIWQLDSGNASIDSDGHFFAFEVDADILITVTANLDGFSATHGITILNHDETDGPDLDVPDAYFTLVKNSAMFTIPSGAAVVVYGNSGINTVGVSSGSHCKMVNFPGANVVYVEDSSSRFTIRRSGATVIFYSNENDTLIQIPSTQTEQKIVFADGAISLCLENSGVMLGQHVLTPVEAFVGTLDDYTETSVGYWK